MCSTESNVGKGMIYVSRRLLLLLFGFVILLVVALVYLLIMGKMGEEEYLTELSFSKPPLGNTPIAKGAKMVKHYMDQFTPTSGSTGPTPGSTDQPEIVRSVYFDFAPMAKYIRKMHNQYRADGIRIYFAKYADDEWRTIQMDPNNPADTVRKNLKDYCTVVIVPTRKDRYGNIKDDITVPGTNGKSALIDSLPQPFVQVQTQAQNGGISCPPYPPSVCAGQLLINYSNGDMSFLQLPMNWAPDKP